MDIQTVLAFTAVAVVVELSPGPNFFLLVRTVPNDGLSAGFGNIVGFAVAFLLHGAMAAFGLSAAIAASPLAFDAVKLVGGAYLMGLGTQALFDLYAASARRGGAGLAAAGAATARLDTGAPVAVRVTTPGRALVDGFATNLFNPKIALFYLAAFPAFVGTSSAPLAAFSLVLVHTAVAVAWFSAVALAFARLVDTLARPAFARALGLLGGGVMIGLGATVVTS